MNVTGDKNYLILVPRLAPAATTRQHPRAARVYPGRWMYVRRLAHLRL